ncbi:ATP-binding protein [Ekhidna sp.]|jgi:AAA15 family ATPase/GTPase|uniref:AAA family ATPase n=1 Tax=Ekhidna sp. TaxID=2608089 RepID=UPI0032EFA30A
MLINFSVQNYKSIYKKLDLSFIAESIKQHEEENLIATDYQVNLLKSLAVYGANGSGKSNLIKALTFMRDFVLSSASRTDPDQKINIDPFKLLIKSQNEPSLFEVEMIVYEKRYKYGFEISNKRVEREYLISILKTTEKPLFTRTKDELEFGVSFSEGYGKEQFIKPKSLFLSTLAQVNAPVSSQIIEWFSNLLIINDFNYPSFTGYTAKLIKQHQHSEFILKVLRTGGLDFEGVEIKTVNVTDTLTQFLSQELNELVKRNYPEQYQVFIRHKVLDLKDNVVDFVDFDLKEESAGIQKFFAISGPIINSLLNGYPIVIDELDARLHFKLAEFIVKLFNSKKFNPYGGQLVYSNHMLDLMERKYLRRDQILLLSKDRQQTQITSFFKQGARSDKSFKRDYVNKEFGGIPDVEFNQLDLFD